MPALPGKAPPVSSSLPRRLDPRGPGSVPGTAGVPLGARASRPQVGRRPTGVFKRARCPRSQERHRLSHRLSRGDSTHAAPARSPGPRASPWERGRPARKWAEGPPVFKRARCPRSQERHRLSHRLSRGDSTHAARARPPGPRASPWERGRPARKWAEGPPVCSSGQDARAPRKGTACLIVSPEATRPTRPRLGPRDRARPPGPRSAPGTACVPLGARASRPQVGRRPTGVQAGKTPASGRRPEPRPPQATPARTLLHLHSCARRTRPASTGLRSM